MKVRRIDFSPDEWLQGTARLDNATRGLYITACALIYSQGGPIELEHLRMSCRDHGLSLNRQLKTLLDLGKLIENDGRITNKRCENELENAQRRSENGQRNASKRWNNNGIDEGSALLPGNANHQPSTTNHQPNARVRARGASQNGVVDDGLPAQSGTSVSDVVWRKRIAGFATSGFWLPMWGEKPGSPACYAPRGLLSEAGL